MTANRIDTCIITTCDDLDAAIGFYTGQHGFRLDMIMPADAPRVAELSGHGITIRLQQAANNVPSVLPTTTPRLPVFDVFHADTENDWVAGRAGMQYRDLLPGRLGGQVIASHIRIVDGGPVPDYVHYHHVGFQMIFCRRGWVRVVYQDQGPPFVLQAGDCVLQPPTIRHRVLESSAGLEVIEIGCPAEHETRREHDTLLPTPHLRPDRDFGGQRFVRHVAAHAKWQQSAHADFESANTGIDAATDGLASVLVLRSRLGAAGRQPASDTLITADRTLILFVLAGRVHLRGPAMGTHVLDVDDSCLVPVGAGHCLSADSHCEVLQVLLPHPA